VTSCALVTEETAEPGEGATFCAIWPALPILSVCSPPTSLASGSPLMLPMMMRPPTSLRRRRLLGRSQEPVCEGGGEPLADLLRAGIVDANDRPAIAARGSPAFSSVYSHEASERLPLSVLHRSHASALLPGASVPP
jgi:hypothetical protein